MWLLSTSCFSSQEWSEKGNHSYFFGLSSFYLLLNNSKSCKLYNICEEIDHTYLRVNFITFPENIFSKYSNASINVASYAFEIFFVCLWNLKVIFNDVDQEILSLVELLLQSPELYHLGIFWASFQQWHMVLHSHDIWYNNEQSRQV